MTWQVSVKESGTARIYRLFDDGQPLSFAALFQGLKNDSKCADEFSQILAGCGLRAFFWELPPLTIATAAKPAEFALIPAPALKGLAANPAPFADQFTRRPPADVVTFENLGGDALLVTPCPLQTTNNYAHLGAFLRTAPKTQVRALWRATARAVQQELADSPRWLSTSGLGVAWLHMRLDTTPKYYQHRSYREA